MEDKSLRHKEEENGRLKGPVSGMLKAAVVGECLRRLFFGVSDGGIVKVDEAVGGGAGQAELIWDSPRRETLQPPWGRGSRSGFPHPRERLTRPAPDRAGLA